MQTIPATARVSALKHRRQQLERRLQQSDATLRESHGRDPSTGRELDDTQALLARLRGELASLEAS